MIDLKDMTVESQIHRTTFSGVFQDPLHPSVKMPSYHKGLNTYSSDYSITIVNFINYS